MKFFVAALLAQLAAVAYGSVPTTYDARLDETTRLTVTYNFGAATATYRLVSSSSITLQFLLSGSQFNPFAAVSGSGNMEPPVSGTDISVTGPIFDVPELQEAISLNDHFALIGLSTGAGMYRLGEVPSCLSACGDPHFTGFDRVKYQFRGKPDQQFALISDPTIQLNSKFVKASRNTFLGATCLRVCNHTITMLDPHIISVDDKGLGIGSRFEADGLVVRHPHKHIVYVEIAGRWSFGFDVNQHVDIMHAIPLYNYDNRTHGVMGHTMGKIGHPNGHCEPADEGGCEVEGTFQTYEVHGDLCSTEWTNSQFSQEACAAPVKSHDAAAALGRFAAMLVKRA